MINLLVLCLVLSSLVSAGVWSPTPEKHNNEHEDVIFKEGHRVVVVEYDQQGQHNTKVSISPEHEEKKKEEMEKEEEEYHHRNQILKPPSAPSLEERISSAASDALDKIKDASYVLPNLGQGLSGPKPDGHRHVPGELICDAYGKCKHRIACAIGKARDNENVQEVLSKAKECISIAKQSAAEKVECVKEGAMEEAKATISKAGRVARETKDLGKTIGEHEVYNVTKQARRARDSVIETAKKAKQGSEQATKSVRSSAHKVFDNMTGLRSVMNLLGFATAYGMCVWVTFISSFVLAEALPRQQFGMVQSKIYPTYFRAMAGSIGLALLGHSPRMFGSKGEMFQAANLLGSVLMVLANSMYLEPRATKVMIERMKVEKEEGRGRETIVPETSRAAKTGTTTTTTDPAVETTATTTTTTATQQQENPEQEVVRSKLTRLSERLKKLNTYSSILNILTLMSLSLHLVYLGQHLDMVC